MCWLRRRRCWNRNIFIAKETLGRCFCYATFTHQFEKLHFIHDDSDEPEKNKCVWTHILGQNVFRSLLFVHPTRLWKWKNNSSKISFGKNNENNKFFRHNCCKLDGVLLLHETQCYKLKLFIFNASEKKKNTFIPNAVRNPPLLQSSDSILYGLRSIRQSLLLCWFFTSYPGDGRKYFSSNRRSVTLQIWF